MTQGETAERLARQIRLYDLPLERDAVGSIPSHDFHPPEAQRGGSILKTSALHSQERTPFRVRQSSLEAYLPRLDAEWTAGCRNGAELWRRLRAGGFTGSLRVVGEWATRRQRHEQAPAGASGKVPSARLLARLMTTGREGLSKAEAVMVTTIEAAVPALDEARSLLSVFQTMIRERRPPDLDTWIDTAARGLLASFAKGLSRDRAAVAAALVEPWSNGQTEGQITRLKLVKRQMYGRAKLDLLKVRLIGAG